jgi:adenylate cyclase class IV
MVEVEKKFSLDEAATSRLLDTATLVSTQTFTDIYYDTVGHDLARKDWWLRRRDDRFELKVPLHDPFGKHSVLRYQEYDQPETIAQQLGLVLGSNFDDLLEDNDYQAFATIVTTRKRYGRDGFTIDIDTTNFGYSVCEIELMVPEGQQQLAEERILGLATSCGLPMGLVRGKLSEYVCRNYPQLHAELAQMGIY